MSFETRRADGVPAWKVMLPLFTDVDRGDIVTYDAIEECLGYDIRLNRSPIYRMQRDLLEVHKRSIMAVPNVGYRVVQASEQEAQAHGYRRRSKRSLTRAVHVAAGTDLSLVSMDQAKRVTAMVGWLQGLAIMVDSAHRRIDLHESMIANLTQRVEGVEKQTGTP